MLSVSRSALAAAAIVHTASASFNPAFKTNVVTYWGQGANQERLIETCKNPDIDIINIGFVNSFPDESPGGYPGDNFGNACWGDVYVNEGINTTLLKTCPYIGPDVISCQQDYGKKIFLSLGGASTSAYYLDSDASGEAFADFLWGAFGPQQVDSEFPRPWGDAVVDGFDFDIESLISPAPTDSEGNTIDDYQTRGYAAMINHLHNDLYPQDESKIYYISGAPQCQIPDPHFASVLENAFFDFIWIQFYNTPGCSARDGVNHIDGQGSSDISFGTWELQRSLNPTVRYYIGLPAGPKASNEDDYYLDRADAQKLIDRFADDALFGGIMVWEATYDMNNTICGYPYSHWMKQIVTAATEGTTIDTSSSYHRHWVVASIQFARCDVQRIFSLCDAI
ncbi:glycoside hydrolase [Teratosphaeria nubilosa]|uniref:chitinase n=1 Tax=Teratosphaeria nubilosa TaxID=161662 RepID=A0A6G1L0T8_9PEZI|nr:glycoside hydrolase [Teratosphaeria nubilosa]